jgi:hypothetical protein
MLIENICPQEKPEATIKPTKENSYSKREEN